MAKKFTDFGFSQVTPHEKQQRVTEVFDSVATRYNLMNDLMSFGIHRVWKRVAISFCHLRPHHQVLDLACGTADLSLLIAPRIKPQGSLTLCDINEPMLKIAKTRLLDKGWANTQFIQAKAEQLPFLANTFDRIVIGFGLRNFTDKAQALAELYTLLKPGGRLVILEFSHPTSTLLKKLYEPYCLHLLPRLGAFVAKDANSYRYLAESIQMHPDQESLKSLISKFKHQGMIFTLRE